MDAISTNNKVGEIPGSDEVGGPRSREDDVVLRAHGKAAALKKGKMAAVQEVPDCGPPASSSSAAVMIEVEDTEKPLTGPDLARILQRCNNDGGRVYYHVHETDFYSDGPASLVQGLQHAFRATGNGRTQKVWLFYNPRPRANDSAGNRRRRMVDGEEDATWKSEGTEPPILCADGNSHLAYMRRFSYMIKKSAAGYRGRERTGWTMFEISLQESFTDQMVLCMLCKSNNRTKTSSVEEDDADGARVDMSSPPQVVCAAPMPAALALNPTSNSKPRSRPPRQRAKATTRKDKSLLVDHAEEARYMKKAAPPLIDMTNIGGSSIPSAEWINMVSNIGTNLLMAAEKAVSRVTKNVPDIDEFVIIKDVLLRIIDEVRLDRAIVTGSLEKLDSLRGYLVMAQHLTHETRALLVSLGAGMTDIIFSAYKNEAVKRAQQALIVLKQISADVQMIDQSWASKENLNVELIYSVLHEAGFLSKVEGLENGRHFPVNSSAAASSSGLKRKADHVPPDALPSIPQELAGKERDQRVDVIEQMMFTDDDEMPDGANVGVYQSRFLADIQLNVDDSLVLADQLGLAESAEDGSRLLNQEVVETMAAQGDSDMSIFDGLLDMSTGNGLPDMSFGDLIFPAPTFALDESGSHVGEECQAANCALCIIKESVAFDAWANHGSLPDFWISD